VFGYWFFRSFTILLRVVAHGVTCLIEVSVVPSDGGTSDFPEAVNSQSVGCFWLPFVPLTLQGGNHGYSSGDSVVFS
jgi:hypothetical protein